MAPESTELLTVLIKSRRARARVTSKVFPDVPCTLARPHTHTHANTAGKANGNEHVILADGRLH